MDVIFSNFMLYKWQINSNKIIKRLIFIYGWVVFSFPVKFLKKNTELVNLGKNVTTLVDITYTQTLFAPIPKKLS